MRRLCKIKGFYMIMLVVTIMFTVCISDGECQAKAKSDKCKTKKITLQAGEKYKIKHKKNAKYKASRPKVASVSKKGLVRAKKNGKCVIKVMVNKKCVRKIKVTVCDDKREEIPDTNSANQDMSNVNQVDTGQNNMNVMDNTGHNNSNQMSSPPGVYPDNFVYGRNNMALLEIEEIDNNVCYIFDSNEWKSCIIGGFPNSCKYVKIIISKDDIRNDISVGDKVSVSITATYTLVGETAIFDGTTSRSISIAPISEK